MNLDLIAAALAARYAPTAVTPPSGYKNITESTAESPPAIPNTPYVIVKMTDGEVVYQAGQRTGYADFLVTLYYARSEGSERTDVALQKWTGVLLDQTHGQVQLGLGPEVAKAIPLKWELHNDEKFGGDAYEILEIYVRVFLRETVTLVP